MLREIKHPLWGSYGPHKALPSYPLHPHKRAIGIDLHPLPTFARVEIHPNRSLFIYLFILIILVCIYFLIYVTIFCWPYMKKTTADRTFVRRLIENIAK
jgi:hypothetical protein